MSNLSPGTVFAGEYRIVQPLSSGGMGTVYIAEQMGTGKRRALKLMLPELVRDERLRARFAQEARVGARIDSEHVVEVVDAGVDTFTGMPYLAMELLDGEDLSRWRPKQGVLSGADARRILEELCHAVGAAHRSGIVHRDLKPENLFVTKSKRVGSQVTLKVLDFGIAKLVEEARSSRTAAVGTPLWMAPEQTEASTAVAPASDVWAIGLIAFWLFTGRVYWRGGNVNDPSVAGLLREVVLDPIGSASQRAAEYGVADRLPRGFDAWFARCVERNPGLRYADATQAFNAIDSLLSQAAPATKATPGSTAPTIQAHAGEMPSWGGYPAPQHATPASPPMAHPVTPPYGPAAASYGAPVRPRPDSGAGTGCLIAVVVVVLLVLLGVGGLVGLGYYGVKLNEQNEDTCADPAQADSARITACESTCDLDGNEYADSCKTWGDLLTKSGDPVTASVAYAKACEKGDVPSCTPAVPTP